MEVDAGGKFLQTAAGAVGVGGWRSSKERRATAFPPPPDLWVAGDDWWRATLTEGHIRKSCHFRVALSQGERTNKAQAVVFIRPAFSAPLLMEEGASWQEMEGRNARGWFSEDHVCEYFQRTPAQLWNFLIDVPLPSCNLVSTGVSVPPVAFNKTKKKKKHL